MTERSRKTRRYMTMEIVCTSIVLVDYVIKAWMRGSFTQDCFVVIAQCVSIIMLSKTIMLMAKEVQR